MRILLSSVTAVALNLGVAACGDYNENNVAYANDADSAAYSEGDATGAANYGSETADAASWPAGSRIAVEEGVTYRIDPRGVRVRLGPNDSRIVVEDGGRFRVDPDGTRVRIDEDGAVIDVDLDDEPSVELKDRR